MNDEDQQMAIAGQINNKYHELEALLNSNIEGAGSPGRLGPLNGDISEIEHAADNSAFVKSMNDSKPPISSANKKKGDKKPAAFNFATEQRSAARNASKSSLNSAGRPSLPIKQHGNPTVPTQTIELTDRSITGIGSKVKNAIQRSAGRSAAKDTLQSS